MKCIFLKPVRGFTLVELLVVLALFTTVITIATGALFSAQAINTKLQQTQIILDGVNLATEQMVRDIRYGSIFYCAASIPGSIPDRQNCAYPNGNTVLMFKPPTGLTANNSSNDRVVYYLSNGMVYRREYPEGVAGTAVQITSSDVTIDKLLFYVKGAQSTSASEYIQPVVTLVISGVTKPVQEYITPVRFSVETTISTRKLDN